MAEVARRPRPAAGPGARHRHRRRRARWAPSAATAGADGHRRGRGAHRAGARPPPSCTVPWPRNERGALAGLKTTSYAENVVALAYAKDAGLHRGDLRQHHRDCSARAPAPTCSSASAAGCVTPPLSSGCLAGRHPRPRARGHATRSRRTSPCARVPGRRTRSFLTATGRDVQPVRPGRRPPARRRRRARSRRAAADCVRRPLVATDRRPLTGSSAVSGAEVDDVADGEGAALAVERLDHEVAVVGDVDGGALDARPAPSSTRTRRPSVAERARQAVEQRRRGRRRTSARSAGRARAAARSSSVLAVDRRGRRRGCSAAAISASSAGSSVGPVHVDADADHHDDSLPGGGRCQPAVDSTGQSASARMPASLRSGRTRRPATPGRSAT